MYPKGIIQITMFNIIDILYTTVYVFLTFVLINFIIFLFRKLYTIGKTININYLILVIRNLFFKVKNFNLSSGSLSVIVEAFFDLINGYDLFILTNKFSNRSELEYKFMLAACLHLLSETYGKHINQQFTFLLVLTEVDKITGSYSLIANPFTINYNVNNPISSNDLFNMLNYIIQHLLIIIIKI
jgi:hypothetical protein